MEYEVGLGGKKWSELLKLGKPCQAIKMAGVKRYLVNYDKISWIPSKINSGKLGRLTNNRQSKLLRD